MNDPRERYDEWSVKKIRWMIREKHTTNDPRERYDEWSARKIRWMIREKDTTNDPRERYDEWSVRKIRWMIREKDTTNDPRERYGEWSVRKIRWMIREKDTMNDPWERYGEWSVRKIRWMIREKDTMNDPRERNDEVLLIVVIRKKFDWVETYTTHRVYSRWSHSFVSKSRSESYKRYEMVSGSSGWDGTLNCLKTCAIRWLRSNAERWKTFEFPNRQVTPNPSLLTRSDHFISRNVIRLHCHRAEVDLSIRRQNFST
jgi:hypothetical protein